MVKAKINKTVLPAESKETLKKAVTNVKHILQVRERITCQHNRNIYYYTLCYLITGILIRD